MRVITPAEKDALLKKLETISEKVSEQLKGIHKCINEAQPIANELGYKIDHSTGKLVKL